MWTRAHERIATAFLIKKSYSQHPLTNFFDFSTESSSIINQVNTHLFLIFSSDPAYSASTKPQTLPYSQSTPSHLSPTISRLSNTTNISVSNILQGECQVCWREFMEVHLAREWRVAKLRLQMTESWRRTYCQHFVTLTLLAIHTRHLKIHQWQC